MLKQPHRTQGKVAEKSTQRILRYDIYTDASVDTISRIAAYAFCVVVKGKIIYSQKGTIKYDQIEQEGNHCVPIAEMSAIGFALKYCKKQNYPYILIHTDCAISNRLAQNKIPTTPLQERYLDALERYPGKCRVTKVKAHAGNEFNNFVDQLAKGAMRAKRNTTT